MNKARRELLRKADALLDGASKLISQVLDEEQDSLDNMPENLQDSERCQKMEEAVDILDSALSSIDEAKDYISEAAG